MILRSFEHYPDRRVVEIDFSKLQPFNGPEVRTSGKFSVDGAGRLFALYRVGGELILRTPQWETRLSDCTAMQASTARGQTWTVVRRDSLPSLAFDYHQRRDRDRDEDDLTPFVEAEDRSFPLWISCIIGNIGRREILISEWSDADADSPPSTPRG